MPRFAILEHDWPTRHWDLLLEAGETLLAWRLLAEPLPGMFITAERNTDHRKIYLDYEGPLSGDRGQVTRWDWGEFEWRRREENLVVVNLLRGKFRGKMKLSGSNTWTCEFPRSRFVDGQREQCGFSITEDAWESASHPNHLLGELMFISDRVRLLFEAACCRRHWHQFTDARCREAVVAGEQYADGKLTGDELEAADARATEVWRAETGQPIGVVQPYPFSAAACNAATYPACWGGAPTLEAPHRIILDLVEDPFAEAAAQCDLLRDIFGNPFRPVSLDPGWLTSSVVGIAESIYDERAFDRLPILADALQDAGCEDADILGHCRGEGPHVRGCWVIDLILGKE